MAGIDRRNEARGDLIALGAYRLDNNLSWRALADETKAAGCPIPSRTLHSLCTRVFKNAYVYDRTIAKVRTFLAIKKITASTARVAVVPGTVPMRARHSRVSA